jgi:hypothetical protein
VNGSVKRSKWARTEWSEWTAPEEMIRRARGRARYNAMRKLAAALRRNAELEYVLARGLSLLEPGTAPRLARAFGVSRVTAWRDVQVLVEWIRPKTAREWREAMMAY